MAPEILNKKESGNTVDIWSFGVIIYQLVVGKHPFEQKGRYNFKEKVNKGDFGIPKNVKMSSECLDFIRKCLQPNPEERIKHSEIFLHPFFQNKVIKEEPEEVKMALKTPKKRNKYGYKPDQQRDYAKPMLQQCLENQK